MTVRLGILIFPNIQQLDLTGPYEVFASAKGAEVVLVWKDRNPVMSSTGLPLTATASFDDCPPLDVICVPGGGGVNALLEDSSAQADANFVLTGHGAIVEVQGTAERDPFSRAQFDALLELAEKGVKELTALQALALNNQ